MHLAEQALNGAKERLALHHLRAGGTIRRATAGKGISVLIWGQWGGFKVGFCALGGWGVRPESVSNAATEELVDFLKSRAGVPANLAAWLLPALCLSRGQSLISVERTPPELKAITKVIDAPVARLPAHRPGFHRRPGGDSGGWPGDSLAHFLPLSVRQYNFQNRTVSTCSLKFYAVDY